MAGEQGDPGARLTATSPQGPVLTVNGALKAKGHDRGEEHEQLASTQTVSLGSAVDRNRFSASLSLVLPRDQPLQLLWWC